MGERESQREREAQQTGSGEDRDADSGEDTVPSGDADTDSEKGQGSARYITEHRTLKTESPVAEVWRMLRAFADEEYAEARHRDVHDLGPDDHKANVRKQAKQIGMCVRQAESYFNSAVSADLTIKPLLLYYGAQALGRALVLLKKDGDWSLDKSREDEDEGKAPDRYKRHGLRMSGLDGHAATCPVDAALTAIRCRVETNDAGVAIGSFAALHDTLRSESLLINSTHSSSAHDPYDFATPFVFGDGLKSLPDEIVLLDVLRHSADLEPQMHQFGLRTELRPVRSLQRFVGDAYASTFGFNVSADGDPLPDMTDAILGMFDCDPPEHDDVERLIVTGGFKVVSGDDSRTLIAAQRQVNLNSRVPLPVCNSSSDQRFFVMSDWPLYDACAAIYAALFMLGMLARYYPDKWMPIAEGHGAATQLIRSLCEVSQRRFPHLILNQMTDTVWHFE